MAFQLKVLCAVGSSNWSVCDQNN